MQNILSIISIAFSIAIAIAGVVVFRGRLGQIVAEIQAQVIEAQSAKMAIMQTEIAELTTRLDELERENLKLRRMWRALITALSKKGVIVKVAGDKLHIKDNLGETVERIEEG